ncbi:aromatic ring-hydroxylating dioxygenase subunit alpha [Xenorhabdus bovienii]|uniref:aromatic ring-hydroxylating oxygenase subunit alpha n=1 Tax=Xenorhabdus bovienii TaxID=40576 RepID=UPI0023B32FC7|nr:aromatic ring-hydroxylating dioxygenase subunit alpha [Xenorhabdus bovienii]MDE9482419.1 aromatic ring-hydroxylating dioxygenase subunit alpha [Xenorhabdus bovienii]MDE9556295.1 aromatic ring-hydroxylating dioxygenase subunit alpha [Xenorhabdus bovienii]
MKKQTSVNNSDMMRSYQQVIAKDRIQPPSDMLRISMPEPEDYEVDYACYTSPDYHQLEMERLWGKVWQVACREEELPEAGDVVLYEIGDKSLMIVRTAEQQIKAFYNSCPHRGRRMCQGNTSVNEIRCAFHGFSWDLDGSLKEVPCSWDFPQVSNDSHRLPEAQVALWGGFVFINMDPQCESLESYLEILPQQISGEQFANKYITRRSRHILPANWKVVMESFMEGLHAGETHGHTWPYLSDILQYDIEPGVRHINRSFHAAGVQVCQNKRQLSEQEIIERFHRDVKGRHTTEPAPQLREGMTARSYMADILRFQQTLSTGRDYSALSEAEALDVLQYSVFPNIILFRGISLPPVLRFRPYENDVNRCIFEIYYLEELPVGKSRPEPADVIEMDENDKYSESGVLSEWLGYIYDQDMDNIKNMQTGMKTNPRQKLTLSFYHESRIRHFHQTLDAYLQRAERGGNQPLERIL